MRMGNTGEKPLTPQLVCARCCPIHCTEETAQRLIVVRGDVQLRDKSLTLSSIVICLLLMAHIFFSYIGRELVLPPLVSEMIWVVILAPWCGAGGGKLIETINTRFGRK